MKVLIAEDDNVSRRLLEYQLDAWGYQVVEALDGTQAYEILQGDDAPQLAIVDWLMPGLDGVELCRRLRCEQQRSYTYVLLLTGMEGEDNLCIGMDAGADDYLTKPFSVNELRVRLRAGRRIIDLQEELVSTREALREKASHDPLTGLWNHEEIIMGLERELARSRRSGTPVGVIMADLDHFKQVNDCYGHMAGDSVLREVSQRMLGRMRPYDSVGRYGGEEFMVVLSGCEEQHAVPLAERLRQLVANEQVDTVEGSIAVTLSLGVAVSSRGEHDASSLIVAADRALYKAKLKGRNRVEVGVVHNAEEMLLEVAGIS
jgi:diguanylate cyclase (GGDEF)-like protein